MMLNKQAIRQAMREQKKALTETEILRRSELLCHMVMETGAYKTAHTIYGYLPFNQEINMRFLLQQALADGKQVALPKCYGEEMRFVLINDLNLVQKSTIGAPEPIADAPVSADPYALVLVPGIAFDSRGYRVGYGGGYYDRFLSAEPQHPTIALCFDFQMYEQLECEAHDIPVDAVLSAPI